MAELRIPIIVENKGKKAFKDVDNSIKSLTGNFKKLAGAAGIGLSTAAVINFGKNAVKAFAENEKSANRLAGVVKNLGLALETPIIEANLDRISAKFGYQGEVLRESYQKLVTATGSLEKSQDLLNLSLDVSAGSTFDLLTVNQDLANLYVGNTRGLKKYNLGLSQAQLQTIKYEDAVALLAATFKGAAQQELGTFSAQMRVLGEAAGNAQEIIGGGLIDALMILTGDTTIEELAVSMQDFAESTAEASRNFAGLVKKLVDSDVAQTAKATWNWLFTKREWPWSPVQPEYMYNPNVERPRARRFFEGGQDSVEEAKRNKARALAEAEALKAAKARAALEKKSAMDAKKKAALEKAARTLELERINLTAGLKGKISETDRLSLQLQLALLDKNDTAASKLSSQLDTAIKRQKELDAALLATPKAPNPFSEWKVPKLDFGGNVLGSAVPNYVPPSYVTPETFTSGGSMGPQAITPPTPPISITVELDGAVVGGAIRDSSINDSLSGSFNTVNRTSRFAPQGVIPV